MNSAIEQGGYTNRITLIEVAEVPKQNCADVMELLQKYWFFALGVQQPRVDIFVILAAVKDEDERIEAASIATATATTTAAAAVAMVIKLIKVKARRKVPSLFSVHHGKIDKHRQRQRYEKRIVSHCYCFKNCRRRTHKGTRRIAQVDNRAYHRECEMAVLPKQIQIVNVCIHGSF